MAKNYLDKEGLLYYNEKLKAILKTNKDDADSKITNLTNTKVDKVDGKGLSTNDFTNELKSKVENDVVTNDVFNPVKTDVESIKTTLANKADSTAVTEAINEAISGVTQFNYEIVTELPETGTKGVIYLIKYSETPEGDIYKEYIYAGDKFECLGSTNTVDLTGYLRSEDVVSITNSEIDSMFTVATPTE